MPTVAGETLGSPPYMSPEQARGRLDEVGPAGDVYSLGATLYCVLTGRPPFRGASPREVLARVVKGEFEPPTAVNRRVPRALGAVCLKAMALNPGDRYPSARALADDVEHWLADEPVGVYPDPALTRVLRWARRHKPLVAASLAVLLAAVAALAVTTAVVDAQRARAEQAWHETERARFQTEQARRTARDSAKVGLEVVDQLVTLGDRQLVAQMSPASRERFLRSAVDFVRKYRDFDPDDRAGQSRTGLVARRLANLYRYTGRFAEAHRFYDDSETIFNQLVASAAATPEDRDRLAEVLIDRGDAFLMSGQVRDAEAVLDRVSGIARGLTVERPGAPRYRRTLGRALGLLAEAHLRLGRADAAGLAVEAVGLIRPLADDALADLRAQVVKGAVLPLVDQIELSQDLGTLAEALEREGRRPEALDRLRQAFERMARVDEQFRGLSSPDVDEFHARAGTRLARALDGGPDGGGDEVSALLDDAVGRLERLADRREEVRQYGTGLADALAARARARERSGRFKAAEADAEKARARLEALADGPRPDPGRLTLLAEVDATLGRLAVRRGLGHEARGLFEKAVERQKAALAASPDDPVGRGRLAEYRARLGELDTPSTPGGRAPR
jgi:tetratricopeptide (TPR) repeat protein